MNQEKTAQVLAILRRVQQRMSFDDEPMGTAQSTHHHRLEAGMAGARDDHSGRVPRGSSPTVSPGTIRLRPPIQGERQAGIPGGRRTSQGPREGVITKRLLERFNGYLGCYARKVPGGFFSSGWPDIVGCFCGAFFAVEVKRPGGKATPLQSAELEKWRAARGYATVATSVEDAERIIVEMEERRQMARGKS